MEDKILYHGSRGGLEGQIKPISRIRCDFGKGFYMGESIEQAKGLIIDSSDPVIYTVKLRLSEIPENRILVLDNKEWLYAILANRKKSPAFNQLNVAKEWLAKMDKYDVIIGAIADDRMNEAVQRFTNFALTDKGLYACLKSVNYGYQYVAKSEFACSKIEVLQERTIMESEKDEIQLYSISKRQESRNVINEAAIKYQREGLYLNEIIDKEKRREHEFEEDFEL